MKYLKVKDWDKFQHYKDRSPPWIKLHRDLLRDYNFSCLQDASKLHLMLIWLLASQMDNQIPADEEFIRRHIGVREKINLKELISTGFLIDDSNALAECKQVAMPETYSKETYSKETERENSGFENFWNLFPVNGRNKGSKKQAIKSFNKAITQDNYENIITGVKSYEQYLRNTGQSNADASTWLNQERWRDDYTVTKYIPQQTKPLTADDQWTLGAFQFLAEKGQG